MARGTGFAHKLYTGEVSYEFVGNRKRWYVISVIVLLICFATLAFRQLNLGIEFKGGAEFKAPVTVAASTVDDVRTAVEATGLANLELGVTTIGDSTVRVQTRTLAPDEVTKINTAIAGELAISVDQVAYSLIGASWGQQITQQALIALGVFLVLVALLIWVYFRDFKMSIAALIALLHDLVITVGIYSLVGFTVTPATMIGVLTILGYSLYDTVVVFDKIRENVAGLEKTRFTYSEQANRAVNQVLIRSINTSVIGVLPVAALLITGAFIVQSDPLKDLGLALFVGMLVGAYSSIFIATPLLADLREREPKMKEHRERLARRASRNKSGATDPVAAETTASVPLMVEDEGPQVAPGTLGLVSADALEKQRNQPNRQSRSQRRK